VRAVQVAAGLVFRGGKVLITQRRAGDHWGGFWEFPGGKCEPDESYSDALRRELREELDIEVTVVDRIECVDHPYADRTVHIEFFRCRWVAGEPRALGCAQFVWAGLGELERYQFPTADTSLLARLRSMPELWLE